MADPPRWPCIARPNRLSAAFPFFFLTNPDRCPTVSVATRGAPCALVVLLTLASFAASVRAQGDGETRPASLAAPTALPPPGGPQSATLSAPTLADGGAVTACEEWYTNCASCATCLRWTVRHDFGDGVGYTSGFTYLEAFVPLYQLSPLAVVFGDARVVNFDDRNRWEFNAGAGYREYLMALDTVAGFNVFYDGRHTDAHFFHQIGVGGEALFGRWEARCNGYIIVGDHQKLVAESFATSIIGNQAFLDRFRTFDVAMGGVDVEVGTLLPILPRISPRAFVGFYHYSAEQMQSVNGIRGRFEAWLTDNCSVHCAVQNDAVFDTTVTGGLALHFGGPRVRREPGPRSPEERLGQRVVRDVNIVVAQRTDLERKQVGVIIFEPPPPVINKEEPKKEEPKPPEGSGELPPSPPPSPPPSCDPPKSLPPICYPPPPVCDTPPVPVSPPNCIPVGCETPPTRRYSCLPVVFGPCGPATHPDHHHHHGHHHGHHRHTPHHGCFPAGAGAHHDRDCRDDDRGPRPQGRRPQGPRPREPRPQGPRPQGPRPQGPRPQGPTTAGTTTAGTTTESQRWRNA